MYTYYVRCHKTSQKVLVKRLLYCYIPFEYNGGSTFKFEVDQRQLNFLKGTFETIRKKSQKENTLLEFEVYKDGIYLEEA